MKTLLHLIASITLFSISINAQPMDSLFAVISYDTVYIWNTGVWENCGSKFKMNVSVSNDTIYLMEEDTSLMVANCLCYFDLSVSVTGLENGNYDVVVTRQIPLIYPDTTFYIGSFSFSYGGSILPLSYKSYQSPCKSIVEESPENEKPMVAELMQNYPNPFNPSTTIRYSIVFRSLVTLKIFDLLGNEILKLIDEEKPAGDYEYRIDLQSFNLSSGVYFYQLRAGNFIQTKKMVKTK